MKRIALGLLKVYQKFFTLFSYGSCRYYPTCSEYAKWQMMHNSFFFGLGATVLRILRCNQLFPGGIDYPVVSRRFKRYSLVYKETVCIIKVRYWFVPISPDRFYVVKTFRSQ